MDAFLDSLPSHERARIRQRMRSPEEYERLRERVKGPEDLERELRRGEVMAELHFGLESQPAARERLQSAIAEDLREEGIEEVLEAVPAEPENLQALREGKFSVEVATDVSNAEMLAVVPEGNVQEKLPVKLQYAERYAGQLAQGSSA